MESKTSVSGVEELESLEIKRTRPFLKFFTVDWWEVAKTTSLGNEIHITTNRKINAVYINGEKV